MPWPCKGGNAGVAGDAPGGTEGGRACHAAGSAPYTEPHACLTSAAALEAR